MGFRFRRSVKIAPGVKFNINKKSVGFSIGGKHSGITINSKSGTSFRTSIPGTGISYRTKISKKKYPRNRMNAMRAQKSLLKDVRELEKMLEAEQLEGYYPSSSTYSRDCEYRKLSPNREKVPPDPHRPATVLDVRTASITNIIVGSFVWWFLSYVLYNWLILRVFIYACWAYNLFLSVRDLIYASDVAERNKEFNAKLDEELLQKEAKKSENANISLSEKVNVCPQDQVPSVSSVSQKYNTKGSYTNWKKDINGKLYPPDTVWVSPNSKVYHCYDICRNSIISSRVDKIIIMSESEAMQIGLRRCSRCDWEHKMMSLPVRE